MDNIIYVDFSQTVIRTAHDRFLDICQESLSEEDYADLLDAIADPDFYDTCDTDIQELVDSYFASCA